MPARSRHEILVCTIYGRSCIDQKPWSRGQSSAECGSGGSSSCAYSFGRTAKTEGRMVARYARTAFVLLYIAERRRMVSLAPRLLVNRRA